MVLAVPFVQVQSIGGQPVYGPLLLMAVVLGGVTMALRAKRHGLSIGETVALAGVLLVPAAFASHWFDVVALQWDRAMNDSVLWLRLWDGHSLFGALLAVAVSTALWTRARKLDLALHADIVAMGCLVAIFVGRIGCTLVHDHLGVPTDLPIGVDVPSDYARLYGYRVPAGETIRLHDLGFEELLLLVPLVGFAIFGLGRRRMRAGVLAVTLAIAYACVRFPLDFLRVEPVLLGLTGGQWGCLAMVIVAAIASRRIARS